MNSIAPSRVTFVLAAPLFAMLVACSTVAEETVQNPNGIDPAMPGVTNDPASNGSAAIPASCTDLAHQGDETDVDCGGATCPRCASGKTCNVASDCGSGVCAASVCQAPTFADATKNGAETDVDCGGSADAPPCVDAKACRADADCASSVCVNEVCRAATATDAHKNGAESDVDCGGDAPACVDGKVCRVGGDCTSASCSPEKTCVPATAADNIRNGSETDIDCGGAVANPRCATAKVCALASDCRDRICTGGHCAAPTNQDGLKNGNESDVDCGGTTSSVAFPSGRKCVTGKTCNAHADCSSDGCGDDGKCAEARTCTRANGGRTCGTEEGGRAGESCCAAADVPMPSGTVSLDKFLITSGRMRALVERTDGNVRGWMAANRPSWWNASWTNYLPVNKADAEEQLGPWGVSYLPQPTRNGCQILAYGARTYDTDSEFLNGTGQADRSTNSRTTLDKKALNCVPWYLAAALCAYDGKRLAKQEELYFAWHRAAAGGVTYPWGNAPAPTSDNGYITHQFSAAFDSHSYFQDGTFVDSTWFVSPPGWFGKGKGQWGHYDLMGNMLNWGLNAPNTLVWTNSWERHAGKAGPAVPWGNQAYYAIGGRCAK